MGFPGEGIEDQRAVVEPRGFGRIAGDEPPAGRLGLGVRRAQGDVGPRRYSAAVGRSDVKQEAVSGLPPPRSNANPVSTPLLSKNTSA